MPRTLFIDDGDIAAQHGLTRVIHPARKHGAPLLSPDSPWEEQAILAGTVRREPERGYRLWYQGVGPRHAYLNLYAESDDGLRWQKPTLGQYEDGEGSARNNIFLSRLALRSDYRRPPAVEQDTCLSVLHTPHLGPERAYTLLSYDHARSGYAPYDGYYLAFSPDGVRWHDGPREPVIPCHADIGWFTYDDMTQTFRGAVQSYFEVRKQYRRCVLTTTSEDGYRWTLPRPIFLPDLQDEAWAEGRKGHHTQFYGMPIVRYESVLLGFLHIFRVTTEKTPSPDGAIDVQIVCSRDGQTWTRVGDRRPVLELSAPGAWDGGMVLVGHTLMMDGDEARLYYSGFDATHGSDDARGHIGLATWPRDRFAGLRADAAGGQVQTTPHVAGRHLYINADASGGEVTAELIGPDGQALAGRDATACEPLRADALAHTLVWRGAPDGLAGRTVSVRLHLRRAEVFAVWWE